MDLSLFDFTKVTTLEAVFLGCQSLDNVNFGVIINTPVVASMRQIFMIAML